MRKCRKGAVPGVMLGVMLCARSVAAWAGPIDIPVPGAATAATPPPAYGSPGGATSSAPAAATAPAAVTSSKPAAASSSTNPPPESPPPTPKGPDYSHVDVSALLVQSFGDQDVGHGERVALSYAVSDGAFFVLDGARRDRSGEVQRDFDVGVGLDTTDDPSRSFYAIIDWTGIGILPRAGSGQGGHGYALTGGVRVFPLQSVELYAQARYDNNPALDGHTSGEIGLLYNFTHSLWLGLSLATTPQENDYFITLRWSF